MKFKAQSADLVHPHCFDEIVFVIERARIADGILKQRLIYFQINNGTARHFNVKKTNTRKTEN